MKVLVVGLSPALDQVLVLGESVEEEKYLDLIVDTEVRKQVLECCKVLNQVRA